MTCNNNNNTPEFGGAEYRYILENIPAEISEEYSSLSYGLMVSLVL